jgi:hypothetical protein
MALSTLAGELSAAVLPVLLGTGVRWAKHAKRDWTTYVAERREDRAESEH